MEIAVTADPLEAQGRDERIVHVEAEILVQDVREDHEVQGPSVAPKEAEILVQGVKGKIGVREEVLVDQDVVDQEADRLHLTQCAQVAMTATEDSLPSNLCV